MMRRVLAALTVFWGAATSGVAQDALTVEVELGVGTETGGIAVSGGMYTDFGELPIERGGGVYEGEAFGHVYSMTLADGEARLKTRFRGEDLEFGPVAKERGAWSFREVPVADTVATFIFLWFEEGPELRLRVDSASYLQGVLSIGDVDRLLVVADTDLDGSYGSTGDCWDLVSEARMVRRKARFGKSVLTEMVEPVFLDDGRALRFGSTDGEQVQLTVDAQAGTLEDSLARRHGRVMAAFDARGGAASKLADAGDRPRSESDPQWRHALDLRAMQAEAARLGKPMLIDFETDW